MRAKWSDSLQCYIEEVAVYPNLRTVAFYLPPGNCALFRGALDYARGVLPNVDRIETYVGEEVSTFFERCRLTSQWESYWGGSKRSR